MPVGGVRRGLRPKSEIHDDAHNVWSVADTAMEVQEMVELAYQHGHPETMLELTMAFVDDDDAPYSGKPLYIRADAIRCVAPPSAPRPEDDD